jgi:heme oxygenase
MSLKELTIENHKKSERAVFVRRLLKKELTLEQYYIFLYNQAAMYSVLEGYAEKAGILDGIRDIKRATIMFEDINSMDVAGSRPVPGNWFLQASEKYIDYLETIKDDPAALMAHIYVRHMGDLSGGQIIKTYVPGPATHYDFKCDVDELKERVRVKLDDSLADEANRCFTSIQEIFEELEEYFCNM